MTSSFARLRAAVTGEVMEPDDPGYEAAHRPAMRAFWHIRPRAVVRCASTGDVARAVSFARRSGLPVVPRSGGHCFAGRSTTAGIVLDLSPLRSVAVAGGTATIGAGASLGDVYEALHRHGVTLPTGCGPTVGIAGLTLGGGLGLLGRRYGVTSDRLRAARVVLADGSIVDCDATREPDLFWALRGAGGGQFGVVTSLTFDSVPAPEASRFVLAWPAAAAAAVVAAWQRWAPDAPDTITANLKLARAEPDEPMRVVLFGAMLGTEADTAALLGDLVETIGTRPASQTMAGMPFRDLKRSFAELDPPRPERRPMTMSKSEFFQRKLPPGAIADLVGTLAEDIPADQHRELNFTSMGGAYNRVPPDATAYVHRAERFLLEHAVSHADDRDAGTDLAARWMQRSRGIVRPFGSARVYPNFPDPDLAEWAEAYHGGNIDRLRRVKRRYDPERLFHFHQCV